jgi:hypothetical protein
MTKAEACLKQPGIPQPDAKRGAPPSSATTPLNFKVSFDFRWGVQTYAAQDNKEMNQLLYEAFAALKVRMARMRSGPPYGASSLRVLTDSSRNRQGLCGRPARRRLRSAWI